MKKTLSRNQVRVLDGWKEGEKWTTLDVYKCFSGEVISQKSLGGILSGLYRGGYIEPLYYEWDNGNKNTTWVRKEE